RLKAFDHLPGDCRQLDVAEVALDHLETLTIEFDSAFRVRGRLLCGQVLLAGIKEPRRSAVRAELAFHRRSDQILFELDRLLPLRCRTTRTWRAERATDTNTVNHHLRPVPASAFPK